MLAPPDGQGKAAPWAMSSWVCANGVYPSFDVRLLMSEKPGADELQTCCSRAGGGPVDLPFEGLLLG